MARFPLLRSRLVAALAKRTLLASSSACLRSSTVRSGARLNIDEIVYHRPMVPGKPGACKPAGRFDAHSNDEILYFRLGVEYGNVLIQGFVATTGERGRKSLRP